MKYMICNILWKDHNVRNRISRNEFIESTDVLFELLDSMEQVILSYTSGVKSIN
jgi:hypothetical protein